MLMKHRKPLALLAALFLAFAILFPTAATAAGDRVIPQVADGTGGDGTRYKTRIDFTNLGPPLSGDPRPITKTQVAFFHQDGSPWTVATNLGTQSSVALNLGEYNTLRIETAGSGPLTAGYVIVRSSEPTNEYAEDYELNISAYYEVSKNGAVVDTISIPVGNPTRFWINPVQTNIASELLTGFAIVNLSGTSNRVTLKCSQASTPSSAAATLAGTAVFTLRPNEQQAAFLNQSGLFPSLTSFQGMVEGTSDQPVAVLALLQTRTPTGLQYATLEPSYLDYLRRNTTIYLRENFALNADLPVVDYFNVKEDQYLWDVVLNAPTSTNRSLTPVSGAQIAALGLTTNEQFDGASIDSLRNQNYTSDPIDLSDGSPNKAEGFSFALKTGLGRYVKLRLAEAVQDERGFRLAIEIFIYK
jgi:hypothetical protein